MKILVIGNTGFGYYYDFSKFYGSQIDPRAFLIMDDCLHDNKWTKDKMMRLLFMNGRHWKIMTVITMQYPLGIPPVLRTNIDYVFILQAFRASSCTNKTYYIHILTHFFCLADS